MANAKPDFTLRMQGEREVLEVYGWPIQKEKRMTDSITTQLVGAHFRPPAKALLACLPAGHPLLLRPEPTNEYDANAVQVVLRTDSLASLRDDSFLDELISQLAGQGFDLAQIKEAPEWHLGYLPRAAKGNPALEEWNVQVQQAIHEVCPQSHDDGSEQIAPVVSASLSFDSTGKPAVIIPWPPKANS